MGFAFLIASDKPGGGADRSTAATDAGDVVDTEATGFDEPEDVSDADLTGAVDF
jgi:hypothetical protein